MIVDGISVGFLWVGGERNGGYLGENNRLCELGV